MLAISQHQYTTSKPITLKLLIQRLNRNPKKITKISNQLITNKQPTSQNNSIFPNRSSKIVKPVKTNPKNNYNNVVKK
jgi:hypothetical protein